jgi:hypothetical protein
MSGSGFLIGGHRIQTRSRSNAITSGPTLLLDVPLVGQVRNMDCWYAAACMVAYYRAPGPRLGLPKNWQSDSGVTPSELPRLARVEGLKPVARPSNSHSVTKFGIFRWLMDYGPLFCVGDWFGFGHAIVLTGIDADTIHLNDPDDGVGGDAGARKTNTVAWFNQHLWWHVPDCVMYKPA